jgi:chemotaxis protein CheZ
VEQIQVEIADISGRIRMTKAEIAALRHPLSDEDKFTQATSELGEVVKATEHATNTIMQRAEELDDIIQELRAQLIDTYAGQRVNDMAEIVVGIFEACNFQDLTGQRITKVVRALTFIEERIDAMMRAWNVKEFETMPLPPSITRMDGELELHGPQDSQLPENFSQDDIDALFD